MAIKFNRNVKSDNFFFIPGDSTLILHLGLLSLQISAMETKT